MTYVEVEKACLVGLKCRSLEHPWERAEMLGGRGSWVRTKRVKSTPSSRKTTPFGRSLSATLELFFQASPDHATLEGVQRSAALEIATVQYTPSFREVAQLPNSVHVPTRSENSRQQAMWRWG